MDWTRAIDVYCERTDAGYWSEPVNALTNLAFLIAAWVMWRRTEGQGEGRVLAVILGLIGIASWLFHTHATAWASVADSALIAVFTITYIYLANKSFLGLSVWISGLGALAYIPYTMVLTPLFGALPFFSISSFYWPLPVLILAYAAILRRRQGATAKNLSVGALLLSLSLVARSLDSPLCDVFPTGTHWIWHCLNAVMLGWMIETWRRHSASAG